MEEVALPGPASRVLCPSPAEGRGQRTRGCGPEWPRGVVTVNRLILNRLEGPWRVLHGSNPRKGGLRVAVLGPPNSPKGIVRVTEAKVQEAGKTDRVLTKETFRSLAFDWSNEFLRMLIKRR